MILKNNFFKYAFEKFLQYFFNGITISYFF